MEVLPTNGRIAFHWLEGAKFYLMILTPFYILILALDVHDNSELSFYLNCIFCENAADFHKLKYCVILIAGNNF